MFKRKTVNGTEKARNHSQRRMTPRMFWKAVMIVTNHAYFNCREDYDRDPWQFPGMPSFREAVDLVTECVNHAIEKGWLDNDEKQR